MCVEHIEQIINCSRYRDELFFTDCKKAAMDILKFLENENALIRNEAAAEMKYSEQSKAA
ncbi:MAG: hypothetical protein WKG06_26455 [Segetibacter sp.]